VKFFGRRTPYSETGIMRVPCCRCGKPAIHQWQVCANGNRYVPVCLDCDIAINALVLEFMKIPQAADLMRRYETLQRAAGKT